MHIDVWSDIACPWCAIGRAHLLAALDQAGIDDATIQWRSFELDPTQPRRLEGAYAAKLAAKYGMPLAKAEGWLTEMTERGAPLGVTFAFDRIQPGNTFDAHRLLHLARQTGRADALKARLVAGYFAEGQPVGEPEALTQLAVQAGLDEAEVAEVLGSDRFAEAVRAEQQQAAQLGVRGVPFFVFEQRYAVNGAQPTEVLVQVLDQVRQEVASRPSASDTTPVSTS